MNSGESIAQILKSNLGFLRNIIQLKSTFFRNVSTFKALQFFMLFVALLIVQVKLTNQNRKIIVNVVRITLGLGTILGLTGTAGMLIYKMNNSGKGKKI